MAVIRTFLGKYILPLLIAVIVSLGTTAKIAIDRKDAALEKLSAAEHVIERKEAELAQERRQTKALTDALAEAERRSQALQRANTALSNEVSDAIRQNPAWGNTLTPDAVLDSLCSTLNCSD